MKRIIPAYKNLTDVLQDAVDKEADAEEFYLEAAELALESDVKNFLVHLAEMERDHYHQLKNKLEALKATGHVTNGILSSFGEDAMRSAESDQAA